MLSRKNYKEVASIIADALEICRVCGDLETITFIVNEIVSPISEMFYSDNYKFDYKRFEDACVSARSSHETNNC